MKNQDTLREMLKDVPCSYAITTIYTHKKKVVVRGKSGSERIKSVEWDDTRCVAISDKLEDLKEIAIDNAHDIHEGCYQNIVIEKVPHGLYPPCLKIIWYEWVPKDGGNKYEGHYKECDEPKRYSNIVNFAFG